jgi:hypothetical protein
VTWRLPSIALDAARDALFPAVRRAGQLPGGGRATDPARALARRPFAPFLSKFLVVEDDRTRRFVAAGTLARWGLAEEEAWAIADGNLAASEASHERDGGSWRIRGPNAEARGSLPGWPPAPLVAIPAAGEVWTIGADDPGLPAWVAAVATAHEDAAIPLSPAIYRVEGARLTPWLGLPAARFAHLRLAGIVYAAQADDLAESGVEADLPPVRLVRIGATCWTEVEAGHAEAWLPEVEHVIVDGTRRAWADLVPTLEKLDLDPPRWRYRGGSGRSSAPDG